MNKEPTVTICEYDKLFIREKRNLSKHVISEKDASYLQRVVIDNFPAFSFGNRCLVATKWVGVIALPDFSVEVLPKIYGKIEIQNLRNILIRMLLVSHQATEIRRLPGSTDMHKNSLVEMLIETFLKELQIYIESGLQHDYKKNSENLHKVKGKILFNRQLVKNAWDPTRFFCRYSSYQEDTPLNRFLKTCLICMLDISKDAENRKAIEEALTKFWDVTDVSSEEALTYRIEFTPINIRAEVSYNYGRLFLENIYATLSAGSTKIYSMLFDMASVYEKFVYRSALSALGGRITYQQKAGYVVSRKSDSKNFICMRPDLTIKMPAGETIILDTKWKIPHRFATESDIYQMNAYSTSSNSIRDVILLYPYVDTTQRLVGDYSFITKGQPCRSLKIRTIDLRKVLSWKDFLTTLKNTLFDSNQSDPLPELRKT